ncbi:hypothetical protein NADFUDRAFT_65940 [Nadsonia fulvescens var. elongata DSM 6958]|uniref:Autophagy-related protein 14 n=1 Tax=Nadsonia fulvescens var. elongata DSM 6958 TaxID=857566 RepID=A0A1E3PL16_9ASCO|nr:hypothetical protein NADFUDRAFT_65940 [Nadsonia fulvescens var. elongata DSM 6958]
MIAPLPDACYMGNDRSYLNKQGNENTRTSAKKLRHLISLSLKNGKVENVCGIGDAPTRLNNGSESTESLNGKKCSFISKNEGEVISLSDMDSDIQGERQKLKHAENSLSSISKNGASDILSGIGSDESSLRNHSLIDKPLEWDDFKKIANKRLLDTFSSIYIVGELKSNTNSQGIETSQSHIKPVYISSLVEHACDADYNPLVIPSEGEFNFSCIPSEYRNERIIRVQVYGRRHLEALKFGDENTQWFSLINSVIDFDSLIPIYFYEPSKNINERDYQIENLNFEKVLKSNAIILNFNDGIYTVPSHVKNQFILNSPNYKKHIFGEIEQKSLSEHKKNSDINTTLVKSYSTDTIENFESGAPSASSSFTSLSAESVIGYRMVGPGSTYLTTPSFDGLLKLISLESCLEDGLNTIEYVKNSINSILEGELNNKKEIKTDSLYLIRKQLDQEKQLKSQIEGHIHSTLKTIENFKKKIEITKRNIEHRKKIMQDVRDAGEQMKILWSESANLEVSERSLLGEAISQIQKRRSKIAKELRSIFPICSMPYTVNYGSTGKHCQNSNKLRFTICGVGFPDMNNITYGAEGRMNSPEVELNTALGHMGQLTHLLSYYLSVPLRYPIFPFGSETFIVDPISKLPHSPNTSIASFNTNGRLNGILSFNTDITTLSGVNAFPLYIENKTGFGFGNLFGRSENTSGPIKGIPRSSTENINTISLGNGGFALFEYGIFLLGMDIVQICESIGLSVIENEGTISDLLGNLKMILLVLEGND